MSIEDSLPPTIVSTMRRLTRVTRWVRADVAVAILVIVTTCALLLLRSVGTWFLNCDMECGETLLAIRSAALFAENGMEYGFLENLGGTGEFLALYTHNVNLGGLLLTALEALGVPKQYHLVSAALIHGLGLYYSFALFRYFTKRRWGAVLALTIFATTYWGLGAFALNPLRAWHLVAFSAVVLHTSQLLDSGVSRRSVLGLAFGVCAAFGSGYDFWIICGATSGCLIVLHPSCRIAVRLQVVVAVGLLFAAPFAARQLQIALVMGWEYWAQDFIYTVAIKVPYANKLIDIPTLPEIDAWYASQNVFRPPASPGNTFGQIMFTGSNMVEHITIPRWGLISIFLWFTCIGAALSPFGRKHLLVATSYRLVLPISTGILLGLAALAPFSLHVYFKHEFPLIAFPLLFAKSLVVVVLIEAATRTKFAWRRIVPVVGVVVLVLDSAMVHWNNTTNSDYPNFGWVDFYKHRTGTDFALSTYELMGYAADYLGTTQLPGAHFSVSDVLPEGEPAQRYWIHQPTDYRLDFDRTMPRCDWTGWLRDLADIDFPRMEGVSCVYGQVFVPGATPPPITLDEAVSRLRHYQVVERNDLGIGYLILERTRTSYRAAELTSLLDVTIEPARGEADQYVIRDSFRRPDWSRVGQEVLDHGRAVEVALEDGAVSRFRYQPSGIFLSQILDAEIREIPTEPYHYEVHTAPARVDFSRLGDIETDLNYPVSVTLPVGGEAEFRFAKTIDAATDPGTAYRATVLTRLLGVTIEAAPGEISRFLVRDSLARPDWSQVGEVDVGPEGVASISLQDGTSAELRYQPSASFLSKVLGIEVRDFPGQPGQYLLEPNAAPVDFSTVGNIHTDLGSPFRVTLPTGGEIGFRFVNLVDAATVPEWASRAAMLTQMLGVTIEATAEEANQYVIRDSLTRPDWSRAGRVEFDEGDVVGVTLLDGTPAGFRYQPSASYLTQVLGVAVIERQGEPRQYEVDVEPRAVDLSRLGEIHSDLGDSVGVTLSHGTQIGFRFTHWDEYDSRVSAAVRTLFRVSPFLREANIKVDTQQGVVTLESDDTSRSQRELAVLLASEVARVLDVVDRMK
jgi:hypothetical protein